MQTNPIITWPSSCLTPYKY